MGVEQHAIGKYGERLACEFLKKKGLRVITTNYQTKVGEIDIIARDNESLIFIEVKTRTSTDYGYPEENVHLKKLTAFKMAVELYILQNNVCEAYRLDVVSVDVSGEKPVFEHFENVTL